jgi:uncharacterized protein (TIGR00255 family)
MIQSMTGYGTGSAQREGLSVSVEVRTVNHRFLDLHVRVPREHAYLESEVQQVVRGVLARGRVDLTVTVKEDAPPDFVLNAAAVRTYLEAAARIRDEFKLPGSLELDTLFGLPGVLVNRETGEQTTKDVDVLGPVLEGVRQALDALVRMRTQEGLALRDDMTGHLAAIGEKAVQIKSYVPAAVDEYAKKLKDRLAQLLPQNGVDPQRVAQEVALLADRSDISEEIARLDSHVEQYASIMDSGAQAGKKLDFLLQEMQREVNTILSKASHIEITRLGIALKSDIEKLREQAQNVE